MSEDAFTRLNFPPRLDLSAEEIETRWRELSREAHPDATSGETDRAAEINHAREILKNPGSRLRHWLEIQGVEIPRNASLDDALMTQFSEIGALLAKTDSFLKKKNTATTAISKALLAGDEVASQLEIQNRMADLKSQIDAIEQQFSILENDPKAALRELERLRFLEKWAAQCQDRLIALLA